MLSYELSKHGALKDCFVFIERGGCGATPKWSKDMEGFMCG